MNIKFYVNNSPLFQKKADTSKTVSEIRELYKAKIPNDAVFLSPDGCEIDNEDESTYKISELISDGIVHMSSKSFVNDKIKPKMIKKSTPINGSKLLGKSKELDLYLYPKYIFNEEEKKRLLKLWL